MSGARELESMACPIIIDGRPTITGNWVDVISPYSGEVVARVASAGEEEVEAAIAAGERAMHAPLTNVRRHAILRDIAAGIEAHRDAFAALICSQAGKPIAAAEAEVGRAAATFRAAAEEALRLTGEMVPLLDEPGRPKVAFTLRKPVGVVAAITPFNFPLNLVAHKVAPAIAAGCAVVLKAAEKTPGAALQLASLALDAGLPPGFLSVLVGNPAEIGDQLARDPRVRVITFTGSAAVGWELARRASTKRVMLELGNITPVLVEPDADLARAAQVVAGSAFGFAGQACVSAQHVLAHRSVAEELVDALLARTRVLVVGDPADPRTDVGPLITPVAAQRLLGQIREAVGAGAVVRAGGEMDGPCLKPTILSGVSASSPLLSQEAFGPLVVVSPYDELGEAIVAANGTAFGLQAAIFTASMAAAMRAARELDFGAVIVNDTPSFRQDHMPYGGVKQSGNTREGPARAIRELTEECLVVVDA